jgi:hypothetical protein
MKEIKVRLRKLNEIKKICSEEEIEMYARSCCELSNYRFVDSKEYYANVTDNFGGHRDIPKDLNHLFFKIVSNSSGDYPLNEFPYASWIPKKFVIIPTKQLEIDFD